MSYEILIILALVLLNGLFAMAEMAVVAARKSRLESEAEAGSVRAKIASKLANEPAQLLSTVQVGITLIGIIAGVYGGATVAASLEATLRTHLPGLGNYADPISYGVVVLSVTYLSVTIGELVPKRLALAFPERIAVGLAPLMRFALALFQPVVFVLEKSTNLILKLIPLQIPEEQSVTEEDVISLIKHGARQGVIESGETEILNRTLRLGTRPINSMMTPRMNLVWIDVEDPLTEIWEKIAISPHSHFPACKGNSDNFLGMISAKDLVAWNGTGRSEPLTELIRQPAMLHYGMTILNALETFRREKRHFGIIIDERGTLKGIVTGHDLLEAIVGDLPDDLEAEPTISQRQDGSLLVDGSLGIDELAVRLEISRESLAGDGSYNSVGGLMTWKLSRVPREGDSVMIEGYKFEVIDMDRHSVDKVLIK